MGDEKDGRGLKRRMSWEPVWIEGEGGDEWM